MSRNLLTLLFITFAGCASVIADPVAVTWNGPPVVTSANCGSCEFSFIPTASESQNGPAADVLEGYNTGTFERAAPVTSGSIDTPFTVSSESSIELAVMSSYAGYGSTCNPFSCDPLTSWTFSGQFSGSSEIVDSHGNVDLLLTWGQSGSTSVDCGPGDCIAGLSLTSDVSGAVDLPAGNYTLETFGMDSNQSIGQNQMGLSVQESLTAGTAVPEPSGVWLILAFGAFLAVRKKPRSNSKPAQL